MNKNPPVKHNLKVWWIPQVPMKAFEVEVPDLQTAHILLDTLAYYDLFQYENNIKPDYCNAGDLVEWDVGEMEWLEWNNEMGENFDEYRERVFEPVTIGR